MTRTPTEAEVPSYEEALNTEQKIDQRGTNGGVGSMASLASITTGSSMLNFYCLSKNVYFLRIFFVRRDIS